MAAAPLRRQGAATRRRKNWAAQRGATQGAPATKVDFVHPGAFLDARRCRRAPARPRRGRYPRAARRRRRPSRSPLSAVLSDPLLSLPPRPPPPPPLNVRKMLSHAATLRGLDRAAAFRDVLEHAPARERARRPRRCARAVFESPDGVVRGNHSRDFLAADARLEQCRRQRRCSRCAGSWTRGGARGPRNPAAAARAVEHDVAARLLRVRVLISTTRRSPARGCTAARTRAASSSSLSAAVAAAASTRAWSESLFVFRGEEALPTR